MISILFLAADPTDASRLRLGEEFREIQEKLKLARLRDHFILELPQLSARPADISQALLDVQPQIVHFSGHGTSAGALCFENLVGETHSIKPDALAALFEQFAEQVECVILNACHSEVQANAIAQHIDYVVGMNQAIGDRAAIAFSVGFYQALGAGRSIEDAYELGCVQIRLENIPEHLTPALITKRASSSSRSQLRVHAQDRHKGSQGTESETTSTTGFLGKIKKLRRREKIDGLIREGEYERALELDPRNVIAIMGFIEELVRKHQFRQASELYSQLKQANDSGVGYSVYPELSLAFEKSGNSTQAKTVLDELERVIDEDISRGYGYLSRSQQLEWVLRRVQEVAKKAKDPGFLKRLRELEANLVSVVNVLTGK